MNTSQQYRVPVLEALCAFVRVGTIGMIVEKAPTTDIQAALTVIGRRKPGPGGISLTNANIPGANLTAADLSDAFLISANLSRAGLHNTNLSGAFLYNANLSGASLSGANLSRAILFAANLSGANLSRVFLFGANLSDADLSDAAHLTQADLGGACGIPKALPKGLTLDKPCPEKPVASPPLVPP
jgi:Pentapeptide repeats (8 copies)